MKIKLFLIITALSLVSCSSNQQPVKLEQASTTKLTSEKFIQTKQLAMYGYAPAQNNLAAMYHKGDGVKQDYKQAFQWYSKAAKQGLVYAQYNLGLMYDNGESVKQDYKQAFQWYSKAAEQGYAPAQYNLGTMYDKGEGVKQDKKQAIELYRKAAAQGDTAAINILQKLNKK